MFSKETYTQRRLQLKKSVGKGLLLFIGNEESGMNYADNTYTFRQDSSFLYFFGLDSAGLCAIIDIDNDKEIIFGNELTIDDIVWMGTQPTLSERAQLVGIDHTLPLAELKTYITRAISQKQEIHHLPPYRGEHKLMLQDLLGIAPSEQAQTSSVKFITSVAELRNHKTEEELTLIENAVDISVDMHVKAMQIIRPGMKECEIAAAVTETALKNGGQLAFPVIATINGQTLHNHNHSHTCHDGQMLLLDTGAENAMHYCGDLSSTMPVGNHFTQRQRIIYDILLDAHRAAVDALRAGIHFHEVHILAATKICEGLKGLGLVKGNPEDAARSGAYALFFPCGLGHLMGLDVHDMECLGEVHVGYAGKTKSTQFGFKSIRLGRPLEPGFVLTIEPGIYFIPELIDKWKGEKQFADHLVYNEIDKWRDFSGVRNEENYVITESGARRLGTKVKPMTIDDVESQKA